jgi:hypothetical protein
MNVLQHFAENQREYLLYQRRLEADHVEATWKHELEQARRREVEAHHREAEAQQRAEQERQAKEQATQQVEHERQEKERLLQLLRAAGINPNPPATT